jgi:hypothetical protein
MAGVRHSFNFIGEGLATEWEELDMSYFRAVPRDENNKLLILTFLGVVVRRQ